MPLKIAYLINQYPKISHAFIRREILALERQGTVVQRIALRGWDTEILDPEDQVEQDRTQYILKGRLRGTARCNVASIGIQSGEVFLRIFAGSANRAAR